MSQQPPQPADAAARRRVAWFAALSVLLVLATIGGGLVLWLAPGASAAGGCGGG
ncbi:hypothetical protein [Streptacidiphilus sp. EB129]|uniref:hypothetical protein n=1 Tax=Streptacidiphilus sp. EB129 TaxID=3156262 RepID=UPI003515271A